MCICFIVDAESEMQITGADMSSCSPWSHLLPCLYQDAENVLLTRQYVLAVCIIGFILTCSHLF